MNSLIVMGASVRALAFSALRAGFQPWAIDLFADRDLANVCPTQRISRYPEDFSLALASAPEAPWMYTGGLENYPTLIDELAKIRPLAGNAGTVLRAAREIVRFSTVVREAGLCVPEVRGESIREADREADSGEWLVKARHSSGGLGVQWATPDQMQRPLRGCYLQRYVAGEAVSAVFVGAGQQAALLGATRQWIGRDFGLAREFLYVGNVGPLLLSEREGAQLQKLGAALARAFDLVGLFNVDLVRNDEGLWPVEVNPRYSASIEVLERCLDLPTVKWHVAACTSRDLPKLTSELPRAFCGKAVVYAEQNGAVPAELENLEREWNGIEGRPGLADLPRTGDAMEAGQPVVTVIVEAGSIEAVEAELRRRVAMVRDLLRV